MHLGQLIGRLRDSDGAAIETIGDIALFARVVAMASAFDETPEEYVAASVGRFAATAADDAWLGLVGEVERAADPGAAVLARILNWALEDDERSRHASVEPLATCGCASGGDTCHGSA